MHIPSAICPVCSKPKGCNEYGKKYDHSACSRMQQKKFAKVNEMRNLGKTTQGRATNGAD